MFLSPEGLEPTGERRRWEGDAIRTPVGVGMLVSTPCRETVEAGVDVGVERQVVAVTGHLKTGMGEVGVEVRFGGRVGRGEGTREFAMLGMPA